MGHHIFKQIHPCAIAKNRDLKDLENRESFLKKLICRFVNVPFGSLAGTSPIRHALSIAVDILWPLLMILSERGHLKPSKWPVIGDSISEVASVYIIAARLAFASCSFPIPSDKACRTYNRTAQSYTTDAIRCD